MSQRQIENTHHRGRGHISETDKSAVETLTKMQGKSLYDESLLAQGSRRGRGDSWDREEDGNGDASGEGLGPCGAILQVLRLYTGSGILAFPYAVSCGGLWAGIGGLVLIAIINLVTLHMLVEGKRMVEDRRRLKVAMEMDPFSMSQSGNNAVTSLAHARGPASAPH